MCKRTLLVFSKEDRHFLFALESDSFQGDMSIIKDVGVEFAIVDSDEEVFVDQEDGTITIKEGIKEIGWREEIGRDENSQ